MRCEKIKSIAGIVYLTLGVIFILIFFKVAEFQKIWDILISVFGKSSIQWCIAWTSIGVGAGLINARTAPCPPDSNWYLHLIGYYGFILFTVSFLFQL